MSFENIFPQLWKNPIERLKRFSKPGLGGFGKICKPTWRIEPMVYVFEGYQGSMCNSKYFQINHK